MIGAHRPHNCCVKLSAVPDIDMSSITELNDPRQSRGSFNFFKRFGTLSIDAGPIVLILDQLDGLRKTDQIGEIESLMIDLKDSGRNWYVIVSLLEPRFDFWNNVSSDPFKDRFGTTVGGRTQLKVSNLSILTPEQGRELLTVRLSSSQLQAQRDRDGVSDPCYPLRKEKVEELAEADPFSARALLQRGSDAYIEAVSGLRPQRMRLSDFLKNTFADIRGNLAADDIGVDTSLIADRITELFNLVSVAYTGAGLAPETGPLDKEMASFRGSDRIYRCNRRQIRVVGHDVQQGNSFPSVLNRILGAPAWTILVRDGRIRASGAATTKGLTQFQQDKTFIHMPIEEIKNLHALGALLAKMKEGDFEHEGTEPDPTEENILRCLARHDGLVDMTLTREFVRLAELEKSEAGPAQQASPGRDTGREFETRASAAPPGSMVDLVARIMEDERWLAFDRLHSRVLSRGMRASPNEVYHCLVADPLCEKVTLYPMDSSPLIVPSIIVWTVEA